MDGSAVEDRNVMAVLGYLAVLEFMAVLGFWEVLDRRGRWSYVEALFWDNCRYADSCCETVAAGFFA